MSPPPPLPTTQTALHVFGPNNARLITTAALPTSPPPPGYLLIKTHSIALNPIDHKQISSPHQTNYTLPGCDYASTVISIGPDAPDRFAPGDRIAGFAHGTFAEYILVKADLQVHIPDHVSFEEAATWGTGLNTCGQAMYGPHGLGLPLPKTGNADVNGEWILIYGAGTSTGLWAVQLAKLSGLKVVAVCGGGNVEYVRGLGADEVVDYESEERMNIGKRVRALTGGGVGLCFDCFSEAGSAEICAQALKSAPGAKYGAILQVSCPREDVKSTFTIGYTALGEEFHVFGQKIPARPEDLEFGKMWWALMERLLAEGRIKSTWHVVREGGLLGVLRGFEDMKNGKVRRQKLVYRIEDTV